MDVSITQRLPDGIYLTGSEIHHAAEEVLVEAVLLAGFSRPESLWLSFRRMPAPGAKIRPARIECEPPTADRGARHRVVFRIEVELFHRERHCGILTIGHPGGARKRIAWSFLSARSAARSLAGSRLEVLALMGDGDLVAVGDYLHGDVRRLIPALSPAPGSPSRSGILTGLPYSLQARWGQDVNLIEGGNIRELASGNRCLLPALEGPIPSGKWRLRLEAAGVRIATREFRLVAPGELGAIIQLAEFSLQPDSEAAGIEVTLRLFSQGMLSPPEIPVRIIARRSGPSNGNGGRAEVQVAVPVTPLNASPAARFQPSMVFLELPPLDDGEVLRIEARTQAGSFLARCVHPEPRLPAILENLLDSEGSLTGGATQRKLETEEIDRLSRLFIEELGT